MFSWHKKDWDSLAARLQQLPHALLIQGPPGTGKTYLAKALAAEAGVPFLFVSASSFQSMYYGKTNRKIRSFFKALRKHARAEGGAIGFIEEIDAIAMARGGMSMTAAPGLSRAASLIQQIHASTCCATTGARSAPTIMVPRETSMSSASRIVTDIGGMMTRLPDMPVSFWNYYAQVDSASAARDRAVARWCRAHGIPWRELPQFGVVRPLPSRRGSLNVDDEGYASQRNVLIEDGILQGYIQDAMNARLMGVRPTGNGRRESYAHLPMPRMTNTYMLGGDTDPAEIIASLDRGLYATQFGGGQVDITSGKFVFSTSQAWWVEKGRLKYPVKGATIVGNGPDALTRVSMIGNDMALDSGIGTCGKEGQSVPVGVGQPTLRIDGLTVGGTA